MFLDLTVLGFFCRGPSAGITTSSVPFFSVKKKRGTEGTDYLLMSDVLLRLFYIHNVSEKEGAFRRYISRLNHMSVGASNDAFHQSLNQCHPDTLRHVCGMQL